MKKYFYSFMAATMALSMGMTFTSCSDDDDNGGGSALTNAGVIATEDGDNVRVYRVGDDRFYYNEDGRLDYVDDGYGRTYNFSYNPNKMVVNDEDYYERGKEYTLSYNGKGYISRVSMPNGTVNLSYDGDGHLTSYTFSGTETSYFSDTETDDEYVRITAKGTATTKLTWSKGRLTKMVSEEKWTASGKTVEYRKKTYTYENDGDYVNQYSQFPASLAEDIFGGMFYELAPVGLLGKGPSELPSSVTIEDSSDYDSYGGDFYFRFNSDGTLYYDGENYYYYNDIEADSRVAE